MQTALVLVAFLGAVAYLGWGLYGSLLGSCGSCGGKKPAADGLIPATELTARIRSNR